MGNKRIPFEPDKMYHVYNHGNGGDNIFRSDENFNYFLKKYAQYVNPVAETYAYCLLPNHFHFLIRIRPAEDLLKLVPPKNPPGFQNLAGFVSRQFSHFFNAYAKAFNSMYNRKGGLFIDDAKRKLVQQESYYTNLIHYIHYNPVHHGFAQRPDDWKHSSYHSMLSARPTALERQKVIDWFGGYDAYISFHRQQPDARIAAMLEF